MKHAIRCDKIIIINFFKINTLIMNKLTNQYTKSSTQIHSIGSNTTQAAIKSYARSDI